MKFRDRRSEREEERNTSNMLESEIKRYRDRERREGTIEKMTVRERERERERCSERDRGEEMTIEASVAITSTESFLFHPYSHKESHQQLEVEAEAQRTRNTSESVQINRENKVINIDTQNSYKRNQNQNQNDIEIEIEHESCLSLERNTSRRKEEERGSENIPFENNREKNSFSTYNSHNSPPLAAIEVEVDEEGERGRVTKEGIEQHIIHSSSLSSLPLSTQPPIPHFEPFSSVPFLPYRSPCDRSDNTLPPTSSSSSSSSSSSTSSSNRSLDCDILYIQESV